MIARYDYLSRYPKGFQAMTGLKLNEFIQLAWDITPLLEQALYWLPVSSELK